VFSGHRGGVPRRHSEQGQVVIEWLGIVLLVGLVAVTLVTTAPGLGSRITCGVERQIATLTGGDGGCARDGGERAAGPAPEQTPFGAPERPRAAGPAPERRTAAGSGRTAASVRGRAVSERAFRTISPFRTNSPTARIAGLKYGFLADAVNGFLDALEGGPAVVEINGYVVPVTQNGPRIPVSAIRRLFGLTSAAFERAAKFAKRFGIRVEVLLATQKTSAKLVKELAGKLDEPTRRRITLAVGVGKDAQGRLKLIVGSSERNGYMRPGVRQVLSERKIEVAKGSRGEGLSGHAERQVLEHMRRQGLKPITIGASRPICLKCQSAIRRAGATFATRIKPKPRVKPRRPAPRR